MSKKKYKPKYVITLPPEKNPNTLAFTEEVEKSIRSICKKEGWTFGEFVTEAILTAIVSHERRKENDLLNGLF